MSFSLKKNNDVNYMFQNSATSSSSGGGGTNYWDLSGTDIVNNNSGNVRINTSIINIGRNNGVSGQNSNTVAIGSNTGNCNQGTQSIAIGIEAGRFTQGTGSIAIGAYAAQGSQPAFSICIDASATSPVQALNIATQGFFVRPIRSDVSGGARPLVYNSTTKEIIASTDATKTFVIDHPIHQDKYLVHACLEGPEAGVYYRGKSEIKVNEDFTEIVLPDYVNNFATDFTVHITSHSHQASLYATEIDQGKFIVKKHAFCEHIKEQIKFSWLVHALRNTINVEPLKSEVTVNGEGPYKYIL